MSIPAVKTKRVLTPKQQEIIDYADAALAVAGHKVTDPIARENMEAIAAGDMTADEAVALMRERFLGK
ncbi:MAG: antitoxin VbhA family protein [Actinomycetaceae bacterium]|nr:antitoxin VbhA family protein [Actinomycetaceae bacterium]